MTASYHGRSVKATPYILLAGFVAGTLDIAAACIQFYLKQQQLGKPGKPGPVLRYIASGIFDKKALGKDAQIMGIPSAAWGLLFHYIIAFLFTLFFFWICSKIKMITRHKIVSGLIYGVFVWLVMNLVIVRMSNVPGAKNWNFEFKPVAISMLILMFCIGLPVSLIIGRYYDRKP